jgi:hypothetical protein
MGDDASIAFDSPVTPFEQKAKARGAKGEFRAMAQPRLRPFQPCILPLDERRVSMSLALQ